MLSVPMDVMFVIFFPLPVWGKKSLINAINITAHLGKGTLLIYCV